jgi:hypothetical protein
MATKIFAHVREGYQLLLTNFWSRAMRRGAVTDRRRIDLWKDDPRLQEALLAVRMAAAFVGESYEVAAARIEAEAARFSAFIKTPTPIGKISLTVKRLEPDASDNEVYQVRNPAEGDAAVSYTFERSDKIVLEFMAHDQSDNPIFPIVRTYSNWSGKRKFDLGRGRTFNLSMSVGDCPELVRVEAGFTTSHEKETTYGRDVPVGGLALAAGAARGSGGDKGNVISWPYGRLGMLSLAIGCLACALLTGQVGRLAETIPPREQEPRVPPHAAADEFPFPALRITEFRPQRQGHVELLWKARAADAPRRLRGFRARLLTAGGERASERDNGGADLEKTADAVTNRVEVSDVLCRQVESPCQQLLASIRNTLSGALNFAMSHALPAAATALGGQSPDALMVAFEGADDAGRMRVTLVAGNRFLIIKEGGCCGKGDDGFDFAPHSHATLSRQVAADLRRLSDLIAAEAAGNETNSQKEGKSVQGE